MNGREVRRRLSACRWAKEYRSDPFFAEALDQAASEPALAEWWAEQRALDDILARMLRELAAPLAPVPLSILKAYAAWKQLRRS